MQRLFTSPAGGSVPVPLNYFGCSILQLFSSLIRPAGLVCSRCHGQSLQRLPSSGYFHRKTMRAQRLPMLHRHPFPKYGSTFTEHSQLQILQSSADHRLLWEEVSLHEYSTPKVLAPPASRRCWSRAGCATCLPGQACSGKWNWAKLRSRASWEQRAESR